MVAAEADLYLPPQREAKHAFDVVNTRYFTAQIPEEISLCPPETRERMAADYVKAAVLYFAKYRTDPYLVAVGALSWRAFDKGWVHTAYARDARNGAVQIGKMDMEIAANLLPDEPNFEAYRDKYTGGISGVLVVPPDFIDRAKTKPIEALATMAAILSQVSDIESGKFPDPSIGWKARAEATQAQFLLSAIEEDPDMELGEDYLRVLIQYPMGIASNPPPLGY